MTYSHLIVDLRQGVSCGIALGAIIWVAIMGPEALDLGFDEFGQMSESDLESALKKFSRVKALTLRNFVIKALHVKALLSNLPESIASLKIFLPHKSLIEAEAWGILRGCRELFSELVLTTSRLKWASYPNPLQRMTTSVDTTFLCNYIDCTGLTTIGFTGPQRTRVDSLILDKADAFNLRSLPFHEIRYFSLSGAKVCNFFDPSLKIRCLRLIDCGCLTTDFLQNLTKFDVEDLTIDLRKCGPDIRSLLNLKSIRTLCLYIDEAFSSIVYEGVVFKWKSLRSLEMYVCNPKSGTVQTALQNYCTENRIKCTFKNVVSSYKERLILPTE